MEYKGLYTTIDGVKHKWDKDLKEYKIHKEDTVTLTKEQLDALTLSITEKVKAELGVPAKKEGDSVSAYELKSTDIPEEDLMKAPTYIYAYNSALVIFNINDRGREIQVPYGRPIILRQFMVEKGVNERGKPTEMPLCRVGIWSKKQLEFLKKHPWYNRIFFDTLDGISRVDKTTMTYRMQAVLKVASMNSRDVVHAAENMNIDVTLSPNDMRDRLVDKYIEQTQSQIERQRQEIAKQNLNNELLMGGKARASVGLPE